MWTSLRRGSTKLSASAMAQTLEHRRLLSTLYVDASAPGFTQNGAGWDTAYLDLQSALGASKSGDSIYIADGIYKPTSGTDQTVSFNLKSGVKMYGGYAGYGAGYPNERDPGFYATILSGDIGTPDLRADNSKHILKASSVSNATIDGFWIAGAYSTNEDGGGVYAPSSSLSFNNCTFIDNYGNNGGAFYCTSSNSTFSYCSFIRNYAFKEGGAGVLYSSASTFSYCKFYGNITPSSGGALCLESSSNPNFINSAFVGNQALYGGAVRGRTNCAPVFTNCTIVANHADAKAGGILSITNSEVVVNSILWNNTAGNGWQFSSVSVNVTYSIVQGSYPGTGNLNVDPLFARNPAPGSDGVWGTLDDDYGDLRISPCSPAVDAGKNSALNTSYSTDLGGAVRFQDVPTTPNTGSGGVLTIDIGAYEATPTLSAYAGSVYYVPAGGAVSLKGFGASANSGAMSYAWEWSGDDLYDDAIGSSALFSASDIPAGVSIAVSIKVTDSMGFSKTASAIVNVVPQAIHVDPAATGLNDGSTWNNAYVSLTDALAAALPSQEIRVAQGTYKPTTTTNQFISFIIPSGVKILGGFAGVNSQTPDQRNLSLYPSILSGNIGNPNNNSDNSLHVVKIANADASGCLDGFTITGGYADNEVSRQEDLGIMGGGIFMTNCQLPISNCIIIDNAGVAGGGAYVAASTSTFQNCQFIRNKQFTYGATEGVIGGAAVYNYTVPAPTYINCSFLGNSADHGGAFYNSTGSPTAYNCIFVGNTANSGSLIQNQSNDSFPRLVNCDAVSNNSSLIINENSMDLVTLTNCILWNNASGITLSIAKPTYCDLQSSLTGTGNFSADPKFLRNPSAGLDGKWGTTDDDYGDLHIPYNSPCVNVGLNSANTTSTDFAGNARIQQSKIDIGAYEFMLTPIVISGTNSNDSYVVKYSPDDQMLRVWTSPDISAAPANSYSLSTLNNSTFTIDLLSGDDTLQIGLSTLSSLKLNLTNIENIQLLTTPTDILNLSNTQININSLSIPYSGAPSLQLNSQAISSIFLNNVNLKLATNTLIAALGDVATLQQYLRNGATGALSGIIPSNPSTSLALIDNSKIHKTLFAGTPLSEPFCQILIQPATPGDANLDGVVNQNDLLTLYANLNRSNATWLNGDVDNSGTVDLTDLAIVQSRLPSPSVSVLQSKKPPTKTPSIRTKPIVKHKLPKKPR